MSENIPVTPLSEKTKAALQRFPSIREDDFRGFKREFLQWLAQEGKNPFRGDGYAPSTVATTHYKVEKFYRWKWREAGGFQKRLTTDDADEFVNHLVKHTELADREVIDHSKSIKRYFKWLSETRGRDVADWTYENIDKLSKNWVGKSRHHFTKDELSELYEAAVGYRAVKNYHAVTPEERSQIKRTLARRFEKPATEIGPDDFERANSWKFPSLVSMAIDLGLRPIEIERANIDWLRLDDRLVVIPKDESSKSDQPWQCVLSPRSKRALSKWLEERQSYDKYRDTDALWLTKYENPYGTDALNRLLDRLLSRTRIEPGSRDLTWYSIRRGAATMWADESGLEQAKEQLRHRKIETTLGYVTANRDKRKDIAADNW